MTQREVGSDTESFEDGVRSAIMQDADAIVIGAMEEHSVVEAAMRAVEAGRLVIGRMPAPDPRSAIRQMLQRMEGGDQQALRPRLAEVPPCVVGQKLVPTLPRRPRARATPAPDLPPFRPPH